MAVQRMSKTQLPLSFGVFKPVGHVVIAMEGESEVARLTQTLLNLGFDEEDVVAFSAREMSGRLHALDAGISVMAGFGSEVQAMRQYEQLADSGCAWLVVYAPDAGSQSRVADAARRHGAKLANKYKLLTLEELI